MPKPRTWISLRKAFALANVLLAVTAVIAGIRLHFSFSAPGDLFISVIFGPGLACLGLLGALLWIFVLKGHGWARKAAVLYTLGLLAGNGFTGWLLWDATKEGSKLPGAALAAFLALCLCAQIAALRSFPQDGEKKA